MSEILRHWKIHPVASIQEVTMGNTPRQREVKAAHTAGKQPGRKCVLCRKKITNAVALVNLSNGRPAHEKCRDDYARDKVQRNPNQRNKSHGWEAQEAAARRAMAVNRNQVLSGDTFRSQKPSTWRVGSAPSSTPGNTAERPNLAGESACRVRLHGSSSDAALL